MSNLCLVSAFYPIRTAEVGRSVESYLSMLSRLSFMTDGFPMKVFIPADIDTSFYVYSSSVEFIRLELSHIPTSTYLSQIFSSESSPAISADSSCVELSNPKYLAIQYGKFFLLDFVRSRYPSFDYILWIDAGLPRFLSTIDFKPLVQVLLKYSPGFCCQYNLYPYILNPLRAFPSRLSCGLSAACGSFFVVSASFTHLICDLVENYLRDVVMMKLPLHNEQIFITSLIDNHALNSLVFLRILSFRHLSFAPKSILPYLCIPFPFGLSYNSLYPHGMFLFQPSSMRLFLLSCVFLPLHFSYRFVVKILKMLSLSFRDF